jgi:hypothetical protein
MANRFLNNIKINDSYTLPAADGTADQVITTDGSGQLSFVDQSAIKAGNAEHVVIYAKNTSGASISKGTPVYITGTVGATDTVEIAPADASNSAKMPAVGLLDDTLANNAFGYVITGGFMDNITTDPIDGTTPSSNDTVYVKAGGGLTLTKPTGASNLIQNIAKVGKVSGGNSGSLIVSSILRTNDVPNLSTGKIWVGDGNTTESTIIHLDEASGEMGVGTDNPASLLHIKENNTSTTSGLTIEQLGTGDAIAHFLLSGVQRWVVGADNSDSDKFKIASSADLNTGSRLTIDTSGNVGIGTTNPGQKLDVDGYIAAHRFTDSDNASFYLEPGSGATGQWKVQTPSGYVSIGPNNTSWAHFYTDRSNGYYFDKRIVADSGIFASYNENLTLQAPYNTTRMTIDSSTGNVGIGTDDPVTRAHIYGPNHTGAFNTGALIIQQSSDDTRMFIDGNDIDTETGLLYLNDYSQNPVRLGDDLQIPNGGIGVGFTSAPAAKVHASDGGSVPSIDTGTMFLASNTSGTGDYSSMSIISGTTGIASLFFGDTDAEKRGSVRYLNSDDALRFRTANTDRVSIKSNGYVGINTTNPGYHLDVDGEARIGSVDRQNTRLLIQAENTAGAPATTTEIRMLGYESRAQGIFFQDSGNSGEEWFAGLNYAGSWDKYSIGYDASGGQGEYVDNAILTVKGSVARVGVKIHDPQADMDVNGTIRAVGGTFTSGTTGADSQSSAGIVLRQGKRILSGISQNSNQDFYLRVLLEHTSSGNIVIGQGGTGLIGDMLLKPGSNGNIIFFGSGSEDMRLDSSGRFNIGTTTNQSGYKLNVNGDIGASTGSQLYMYQNGGTGSTNAVIRVTNLNTSGYGQTTPNFYSDAGNHYGNRHCEFATNGTVRGYIGHDGSVNVVYSTTSSDERLKKNIEAWDEDTLGKFRNIEPKKFNFIDQEDTDSKEKGYIAQNMVDNFPEAYPHDFSISQTEGMYSFNPSGMVVYLMKAVKDLIAENDNLKARVEALENA